MKQSRQSFWAVLTLTWLWVLGSAGGPLEGQRISEFGRYEGYTAEVFDGWLRRSEYVEMGDGVKLAVDTYLPTRSGEPASERLPVVLRYTRYYRAFEVEGEVRTPVEDSSALRMLLRHGYAVAVADARGTGSSFGVHNGPFSVEETDDVFEIVEWLAAQPWCNGRVGMGGRSYPGTTQYLAASKAPPSLVAIFPEMAGTSFFDLIRRGGTYKSDFIRVWNGLTRGLDLARGQLEPAAVDGDIGGLQRDAAVAQHAGNLWAGKIGKRAKFRDWSTRRSNGARWSWELASPLHQIDRISESGVAIYHVAGWLDLFATQQPVLFSNLSNPQRLMIGPWTHTRGSGSNPVYLAEMLRWFDFWLKDVDNGIMDEKPVHYWLMRADNTVPADRQRGRSEDEAAAESADGWETIAGWPPRRAKPLRLYLSAGRSGTVASSNDGRLLGRSPKQQSAWDEYVVDDSSSVGSLSRWMVGYDAERSDLPGTTFFDERTAEDEKALTFTSRPLSGDLEVVGHPVVRLWVSASRSDADLFVYLEEVDAEGRSHYVTEGALRGSYRALAEPPWDNLGLPFHPGLKTNLLRLSGEPVELQLDLLATANLFDEGHRIRLAIAGADAANHKIFPGGRGNAVEISLYRDRRRPSVLELPVLRR